MKIYLVDSLQIINGNEIRSYVGCYSSKVKAAKVIREALKKTISEKAITRIFIAGHTYKSNYIPTVAEIVHSGYLRYEDMNSNEGCYSYSEFEVE